MLKEAAASGVEADVFNPSFVCKFFERDWVVQYFGGFYDNNLISDVISRVKGGKEANVYVCVARPHVGPELLAGKLYRPRMFRNLKNDAEYRVGGDIVGSDGKVMRKKREQRAVAKRTDFGQQVLTGTWLSQRDRHAGHAACRRRKRAEAVFHRRAGHPDGISRRARDAGDHAESRHAAAMTKRASSSTSSSTTSG